MELLEFLNRRKKKRKSFIDTFEYKYFNQNKAELAKFPKFSYLQRFDNGNFDIMRCNVLLRAYQNKILLEEEANNISTYEKEDKFNVESYKEIISHKMLDQPYLKDGNNKIYIPFFSKIVNLIYTEDPKKLLKYPYSTLKDDFQDMVVDPFDTYGYELFNSYFTSLVKIYERDGSAAFFNYDLNVIYIINSQGRLDGRIVLFDKYIRRPNYNHMLERMKPVVEAYFNFDMTGFVQAMKDQGFISNHMFYLIKLYYWRKNK